MGIKKIDIRFDSQLVVNQLLRTYQARNLKMVSYLDHVKTWQSTFKVFNIVQIPKLENNHADALANLGSSIPAIKSQSIPLIYLQWHTIWKDPPA